MAVYRLVHQSEAAGRAHELPDTGRDLAVVVGREDLRDDAHGPAHAGAEVRAAGGVDDGPVGEVGVPVAEGKVAGVPVDHVRVLLEAQVRDAEKRGEVGVVLAWKSVLVIEYWR